MVLTLFNKLDLKTIAFNSKYSESLLIIDVPVEVSLLQWVTQQLFVRDPFKFSPPWQGTVHSTIFLLLANKEVVKAAVSLIFTVLPNT